jgi:hypothetical protein
MPLRCPVCKADNSTGPACRRCKADLEMLFALEDRRTALLVDSRQALMRNNRHDALHLARAANDLRQDSDTQRWLAVVNLLMGNFGEAWRAYQCVKAHG